MFSRRLFLKSLCASPIVVAPPGALAQDADLARRAVVRADQIRNPQQSFRAQMRLTEFRNGQARAAATLVLHSKPEAGTGRFRNLARYVEPAADFGKAILMDDQAFWFYDPASSASIRISPQQRLVGQAANGDVMSVNFGRDYAPRMMGEESIRDADNAERKTWRVELTASSSSAVYLRIEYWIERDTCRPVKARFFVDSGRALKVAFYRKFSRQLGEMRPGEVVILDEVDKSVATKLVLTGYAAQEIPDNWFNREYLPRLRDGGGAVRT
ncbi:outer membrane lipoprotein-sorting protein [Variovorax sp. J22R24]|uniref:outer membrane lipoprotein-sorting protein n=1 Tax=Variovorax gracilis TaxID=3053502 RepID=UPI00257780E5|nr:outer membrane lipoprotein-sorting protein [Variovorax sp. J22R24]MDM0106654.1 outer membrane lipoprotein-sorting protein [Variovorax sp. J22R24]